MFTDSVYWNNVVLDFEDKSHPLFVCSAGIFRLISCPKLTTYRPDGRLDYQLLYIASGTAHFFFDGKEQIINAGNVVLYNPHEPQQYFYYGVDQTEVYWVHFTGSDVKLLLRRYHLSAHEHVFHVGISPDITSLFHTFMEELRDERPHHEDALSHYLQLLLIKIGRLQETKPHMGSGSRIDTIEHAVSYFRKHYTENIQIEEHAEKCGMSTSWFIRNFKDYTGSTPMQYILLLRISKAQTLLESTAYNITEIADQVGYDNPLYFSRLFRKQCGVSPKEFRKQLKNSRSGIRDFDAL
ncbi:MAG: AraC family transcriptional regulator [Eubacteriales bacterium]|nr:AraC family transcriptional regulator [Eubacteriales bacterium]